MNGVRVSDSQLELTDALFFQTHEQELVTYILNLWPANSEDCDSSSIPSAKRSWPGNLLPA